MENPHAEYLRNLIAKVECSLEVLRERLQAFESEQFASSPEDWSEVAFLEEHVWKPTLEAGKEK